MCGDVQTRLNDWYAASRAADDAVRPSLDLETWPFPLREHLRGCESCRTEWEAARRFEAALQVWVATSQPSQDQLRGQWERFQFEWSTSSRDLSQRLAPGIPIGGVQAGSRRMSPAEIAAAEFVDREEDLPTESIVRPDRTPSPAISRTLVEPAPGADWSAGVLPSTDIRPQIHAVPRVPSRRYDRQRKLLSLAPICTLCVLIVLGVNWVQRSVWSPPPPHSGESTLAERSRSGERSSAPQSKVPGREAVPAFASPGEKSVAKTGTGRENIPDPHSPAPLAPAAETPPAAVEQLVVETRSAWWGLVRETKGAVDDVFAMNSDTRSATENRTGNSGQRNGAGERNPLLPTKSGEAAEGAETTSPRLLPRVGGLSGENSLWRDVREELQPLEQKMESVLDLLWQPAAEAS